MKTLYLSILAIFLGFVGLMLSCNHTAYGIWVRQSPQELLNDSATIFVGNITSVNILQFEKETSNIITENGIEKNVVKNYTLSIDEYHVNIEEFLKNPQNTNKISVRQPIISLYPGMLGGLDQFHVGDRVLFYIKSLDGNNTYSPESFIIPKFCVATNVLVQNRLVAGGESFAIQNGMKIDSNFTANKPVQFVDNEDTNTLSGKNLDTMVQITKNTGSNAEVVFNKEIHSEAKPCEWIAQTEWQFTPQEGEYRMYVTMIEDNKTYAQYSSKFFVKSDVVTSNYVSPLKQFKSGIKAEDVKCTPNLHLIIKAEDGSFACVSIETGKHLALRGWATTFGTGMIVNDYNVSCNTAYPRSDSGIAVLYMPTNSVGKVCVRYSNLNNVPTIVGDRIFDANNITNNASDVTTWASTNTLQGNDNATIVYSIKTGNKTGFYGLSLTCGGIPLAVGYDANSTITTSDFPWANQVFNCGSITYDYHIEGTKGIGVRYIPDYTVGPIGK